MTFEVAAEAYGRFMGRYSEPLAVQFLDSVGVRTGQRVLDVGCGPGVATAELVRRLGAGHVAALDPSVSFVAATRARLPAVEVTTGVAEQLPYEDDSFDASVAQLVVHFMTDPVAGLSEMRRVTRPGGPVGACVWDHAGGRGPLSVFWAAARELDPQVVDEGDRAGAREGHLVHLCEAAALADVTGSLLSVRADFQTASQWWETFTLGVGPAGDHLAELEPDARHALRDRCTQLLPTAPFTITASAWCAVGRA